MNRPVIQARGLTKDYGQGRGLFDLDLDVHAGEVFGFLGPNGAGKTTTIRLLQDYIRPSKGAARILGKDPRRHSVGLRRQVGYLPGELELYERLTGAQLLDVMARLHGDVDRHWVGRLAGRLRAELDRPIGQLSSGNKQKVGILLAWLHRPRILILDEPTSGLDPLVQQEVHDMIREHRDHGGTVFLSSHILPEVEEVCDRVGIVRDGKLLVVEDLATLKGTDTNRLLFTFGEPVRPEVFAGLEGVTESRREGDRVLVTVHGSVDQVVKVASTYEVLDLESADPDLEEVFMRYYRRERHA